MAGAARELSGLKDNPRSSRSRFRGCRRHSQIHHRTSHAVILSMMGWQPHDSNLPAQAVFLDSGHEKSIHNRCSLERQCQLSLQPAGIRCILLERLGFQPLYARYFRQSHVGRLMCRASGISRCPALPLLRPVPVLLPKTTAAPDNHNIHSSNLKQLCEQSN